MSSPTIDPGPYLESEGDGPGLIFPVESWTYRQARKEAARMARDNLGDFLGRSRYTGRQMVPLTGADGESLGDVDCWWFEEYER